MLSIEFLLYYAAWLAVLLTVSLMVHHQADSLQEVIFVREQFTQNENHFLNCESLETFHYIPPSFLSSCLPSSNSAGRVQP